MSASRQGPGAASGPGYLEHLGADDLVLLARAAGIEQGDPGSTALRLRGQPERIERLLASPEVFAAVFQDPQDDDPFLRVSPFLVFAVAVNRTFEELGRARFVEEWWGPRQRLPVFAVDELRGFLGDPRRRRFLVELLASYTHVSSGSMWVQTRRGPRRQRFSELDPVRLASLLEVLPETEHAGVYRRLGDLALFMTGLFPDHTATRSLRPVDLERLWRTGGRDAARGAAPELGEALGARGAVGLFEHLGERWYRLAVRSATPLTGSMRVVGEVAERFGQARRVLNHLTDRYLFPLRSRWFPAPGG